MMFWVMQIYISLTSRGVYALRDCGIYSPTSARPSAHSSLSPARKIGKLARESVFYSLGRIWQLKPKKVPGIYMVGGTKPSGNFRNSPPRPGTLKCNTRIHAWILKLTSFPHNFFSYIRWAEWDASSQTLLGSRVHPG